MAQIEFVPGQRWISNTEAELGLGLVLECANRRVELIFPAVEDRRTYASDNAPLSRVCYEVGETVTDNQGVELEIRERVEHKGCFIYIGLDSEGEERILPELELNSAVHFSRPQERLFAGQIDRHGLYKLRVETLVHQHRLRQSPAYGLTGPRVQLLPHQFHIAAELASRHAPRALLADEVGLGKTIEAGLLIHQRLFSGNASRVLIVVPDSLVHQWLVEMLRRFNLSFTLLDEERCEALEESGTDNPFEGSQLVICALSLLTRHENRQQQAEQAGWDLLVVDEAHHLGWSREVASHAYLCIEALAALSPGVLLLTATPEQLGPAGHFARLKLLDPERYHDLDAFLAEERQYHHLNRIVAPLLETNGAELLRGDTLLQREAEAWAGKDAIASWLALPQIEQPAALNKLVKELVDRQGTGRVLFRNTRQTISGFPARILHTYPLEPHDIYDIMQGDAELESCLHPELLLGEDWIKLDPRVEWLQEWIRSNKKEKALIICAHAASAIALENHLSMQGVRSSVFHEGMSLVNRDRSAAYFADEELGAQVLVCSEIGSEGRNFQFCHHLILFDLPLSPDLVEQRIGRLDRIGQHRDVQIHLPYYRSSPAEVLMRWYRDGLDLFSRVCAVGDALYHQFAKPLRDAMHEPGDPYSLARLIDETLLVREELENELANGRDRLLELSSCNTAVAERLLEQVREHESNDLLQPYAERLFDRVGISVQPHGQKGIILQQGENMLCHLAGLPEEGLTLTFSRKQALAREDIQFLTWEHPLLNEVMELIGRGELGNNTICTLRLPALTPGLILLEAIYDLHLSAPRSFQLSRFLPCCYLRTLVDSEGRDLSGALGHAPLNQLAQPIPLSTSQKMMRLAREQISSQLTKSGAMAEKQRPAIIEQALEKLHQFRDAEYDRLQALAAVNPAIREEELAVHQRETRQMHDALSRADLKLDALRVIIVSE
ncbi:RNA polymerase-associated protein RapA [Nitrincola sp. MINF-07-Sa-05]|uniref:RNA polymerase-associated protein RapA n=1 Tax=Nitrincola salilacus TaxID=3400273 RepID=UPI00391842AA